MKNHTNHRVLTNHRTQSSQRIKTTKKIIAVDFDGCLATNLYPKIGEPIPQTVNAIKLEKAKGTRVILWTCRCGERLTSAVEWCTAHGIFFDAVNENLPENIKFFGGDTRKIYANEYWDDRAVLMPRLKE